MIGAIVYELKAMNSGSLLKYHGQKLHGICFSILREYSAELADRVHNNMSIKPFTSAELDIKGLKKSHGEYVYIQANTIIYWRVTALNDEVLNAFLSIESGKIIVLGDIKLRVERRLSRSDLNGLTEIFEPADLVKRYFSMPIPSFITMEFKSVTTFRSGVQDYPWPLPTMVFGSLADKWKVMKMPKNISPEVVREKAALILPHEWQGRSRKIFLASNRGTRGFVGRFSYRLDNLSDEDRKIMLLLAGYAEYAGVGRWNAHGLGQTRLISVD